MFKCGRRLVCYLLLSTAPDLYSIRRADNCNLKGRKPIDKDQIDCYPDGRKKERNKSCTKLFYATIRKVLLPFKAHKITRSAKGTAAQQRQPMTAKKTTTKPPMKGPKRPDKARAPDWPLIRLEYVNSFITYADLARKHGIRESTVVQQGNRHKWEAERNTVSSKVMAKAQSELEAERVARLKTINENHLRVANDLLTQVASALTEAANKKESIPAKDVRALASAAEAVQRISRLALGATTDNHGLSNPDGGPVATTAILPSTEDRYLAARARVINKY